LHTEPKLSTSSALQDAMEQREEAGVQLYGFQQQLSAVQSWLTSSKEQV